VLAVVMLLIFGFSITPKIILHDIVANHKDTPFQSNHNQTAQLSAAGFSCNCDNLVVESPYTKDFNALQIKTILFFKSHFADVVSSFYSQHHFYSGLRGPPAFIS
jgi:hypothetical protein